MYLSKRVRTSNTLIECDPILINSVFILKKREVF